MPLSRWGSFFFTEDLAELTGICGQSSALLTKRGNAPGRSLGCLVAEDVDQWDIDQGLAGAMEGIEAVLGPSRTTGWLAHPELLGFGRSVLGGPVRVCSVQPCI